MPTLNAESVRIDDNGYDMGGTWTVGMSVKVASEPTGAALVQVRIDVIPESGRPERKTGARTIVAEGTIPPAGQWCTIEPLVISWTPRASGEATVVTKAVLTTATGSIIPGSSANVHSQIIDFD